MILKEHGVVYGKQKTRLSFTIIEVLLAMGLFALTVGGGTTVAVQAFSTNRLGEEESYANLLVSEGIEAVRAIATRDYFNLVNGTYGLTTGGNIWGFSGSSDTFGRFTRTILISNVYRDASKNIVNSGGTLDLFTKKVESRITWSFSPGRTDTVSLVTYLTFWQTSICNWSSVSQAGSLNLPGSGDAQDISVVGSKAYVTTMSNSSAGEFFILSLSNPSSPTKTGEFEVGGNANAVAVSGNYAYLATSKSGLEMIVVNVSNPSSPTKTTQVDIPGVTQANDIAVSGNYAYVVTPVSASSGEFYIYDVSSPGSPVLKSNFEVGSDVNSVYVNGGRAYLATARADKELIVLDVSNPLSPSERGSYDIPSIGATGQSVFYGGGVVYLMTRDNTGSTAEYYLLDASNPTSITLVGSLDISGRVNGIAAGVGFSILATEKTGQEFTVVSTTNPSSPTKLSSLGLNWKALGMALQGCYAYIASADDNQEIKVVTPH